MHPYVISINNDVVHYSLFVVIKTLSIFVISLSIRGCTYSSLHRSCVIFAYFHDVFRYFKNLRSLSEADVSLSQVVSKMIGPNLPTLSEDLLQTNQMTIEDLIESTEVIVWLYLCLHI